VPLSWNLGTLTSWDPLGHSRPVTGLLYLLLEGGEGSSSRPVRNLLPGMTRYSLYRMLGGPQGRVPDCSSPSLSITTLPIWHLKKSYLQFKPEDNPNYILKCSFYIPKAHFFFTLMSSLLVNFKETNDICCENHKRHSMQNMLGENGTRAWFSLSTLAFPCQYHSPIAPYPFIRLSWTKYTRAGQLDNFPEPNFGI
jgi:hypothetical protein